MPQGELHGSEFDLAMHDARKPHAFSARNHGCDGGPRRTPRIGEVMVR